MNTPPLLSRILFCWLACFFLSAPSIFAQLAPGRANLSGWNKVSTDRIDLYFLEGNRALADKAVRYAERALFEVANLYDYRPQARYTLFLLSDAPQLAMTHHMLDPIPQASGVFQLPRSSAYVTYPGSSRGLYQQLKRVLAKLILREFSYGDRLGQAIQNQRLLENSPWYTQGLAAYVGEGWTYEDEMWVNSIASEELERVLDLSLEGEGQLHRTMRKSIWRYVTREYGDQKLAEIIYLVNISHSLESGIISVLGITVNTLTSRWRESLRNLATNNASGRTSLAKLPGLQEVPVKPGYRLLSFAYNPVKDAYALYLEKNGQHELFIYTPENQNYRSTGVISLLPNDLPESQEAAYPLAWSKDGRRLMTTFYEGKEYRLALYEWGRKQPEVFRMAAGIGRVLSMDWAHNGQLLAVSALKGNRPQIFLLKAGTNNFIPITDDPFDNLEPCWSFDDQMIFFSSNRDTVALKVERAAWESYQNHFDLFMYERNGESDTLTQLTRTPATDESQPMAPNSFELIFRTDESGILNLNKINIFLKQKSYLTDLAAGLLHFQTTEEKLVFSAPVEGEPRLFSAQLSQMQARPLTELSLLRTEKLTAFNARRRKMEEASRDLLAAPKPRKTQEPKPQAPRQEEKKEGKEGEEDDDKPARYYIFDDFETPYEVKKQEDNLFEKREKALNQQKQSVIAMVRNTEAPDLGKLKVSNPLPARTRWQADFVSMQLGRRPDAGAYLRLGSRISDQFNNHIIEAYATPYLDFRNFQGRNGELQLNYAYLKGRLDFYAGVNLLSRHYRRKNTLFPLDSALYRYDNIALTAGLRYPFSNYSALSLEGSFHFLDRKDQKLLNQELLNQRDRILRMGLRYAFDKTKERQGFTYAGMRGEASFFSHYSLPNQGFLFHTASLSLNKYTEIYDKIVLANRFVAGYSFGPRGQMFYIGGQEDWVPPYIFFTEGDFRLSKENAISTDLLDFSFQQFITPMRGFWFFSRSGSRYFALSSEVRIPISRLLKQSLNTNPLYRLQLIPFVDIGSVWTSGNPFSATNPTDTRLVGTEPVIVVLRTLRSPFLITAGTGMQTSLLGYSVRMDLGWGIEDGSLQTPVFSLSLGKNF
jgi:hypothetical protein